MSKYLDDPFIRILLKESIFTKNQIYTLLDYQWKKARRIKIKTENDKVTIGERKIRRETYYNILKSCRIKIKKLLASIILLIYLNVISYDHITTIINLLKDLQERRDITILDTILDELNKIA